MFLHYDLIEFSYFLPPLSFFFLSQFPSIITLRFNLYMFIHIYDFILNKFYPLTIIIIID